MTLCAGAGADGERVQTQQACTHTSSLAATRGSQAVLEAAVSSAICHPNIVQTFDYQVVDLYQSANVLRTEANRVRSSHQIKLTNLLNLLLNTPIKNGSCVYMLLHGHQG